MIATTDPQRKNVYVFADLPTGTVRELLRTVPGLRQWSGDGSTTETRSRDTSASTRTSRADADARATEHVEARTPVRDTTPPPFRDNRTVVEVAPATQTTQTSSYVENQKTLERSLLPMADHGPAKGGAAPEWLGKAIAILVVVGLGFVLLNSILNWSAAPRITMIGSDGRPTTIVDDWTPRDDVVRRRTTGAAPGSRIVSDDSRGRGSATTRRLPSPEEVARSVPHRRERTPVDCVDTHWRAENSNRCVSIQWVPGDD